MNWERVQTAMNRYVKHLGAKRVWPQQYGANNGFGIAADWGNGKKASAMVSRSLPDRMTDVQLDRAVADAVGKLAEKAGL
jgi:hypothetical protein